MSATPDLKPEPTPDGEEQELCIQCLTTNGPGSNFCRNCGAPLSSYAATGPFESLFAEGHIYRTATEQPRQLSVVLGIWMIFCSVACGGVLIAASGWQMDNLLVVFAGIVVLLVSAFLIWKTTKNYFCRPPRREEKG